MFIPGDVVICIDAGMNFRIEEGKTYVVDRCNNGRVKVVGSRTEYYERRFVLADEREMQVEYV